MDSGVIDAATFAPHAHLATKTYAIGTWASTNLNLGSANCPVVVNTDALNALPSAHRDALLGSVDEAMDYYVKNYNENTTGKYEDAVTESRMIRITFSPNQTAELNRLAVSVRDDWVKKYADKFDAKTLFDFTARLFNE